MQNVLILHGTDDNSHENWFPWLKAHLEENGYDVWVPDLPQADHPNIKRYNKFIFNNADWKLHEHSILIGHSSGAVAILGLLEALPEGVVVDRAILVGAFKDDLGWEALTGLFEHPFDFEKIRKSCRKFIFIHSDNDPYCPLEHAKFLAQVLGGELHIMPGEKHFSIGTVGNKYLQFPALLKYL